MKLNAKLEPESTLLKYYDLEKLTQLRLYLKNSLFGPTKTLPQDIKSQIEALLLVSN